MNDQCPLSHCRWSTTQEGRRRARCACPQRLPVKAADSPWRLFLLLLLLFLFLLLLLIKGREGTVLIKEKGKTNFGLAPAPMWGIRATSPGLPRTHSCLHSLRTPRTFPTPTEHLLNMGLGHTTILACKYGYRHYSNEKTED